MTCPNVIGVVSKTKIVGIIATQQIVGVLGSVEIVGVLDNITYIERSKIMTNNKNLEVTVTSDVTYTAFESYVCRFLNVVNGTDEVIYVQRGGTGAAIPIPAWDSYLFGALTNSNQISVRTKNPIDPIVVSGEAYI
jgi:hypothetical protein